MKTWLVTGGAGFIGANFVLQQRHDKSARIVNLDKLTYALGWTPKETFQSGLIKTVHWYLDNPQWLEAVTSGAYRQWLQQHYGA